MIAVNRVSIVSVGRSLAVKSPQDAYSY